jgi:hypothetical protein
MNERATSFFVDMLISLFWYVPPWESVDAWIVPTHLQAIE